MAYLLLWLVYLLFLFGIFIYWGGMAWHGMFPFAFTEKKYASGAGGAGNKSQLCLYPKFEKFNIDSCFLLSFFCSLFLLSNLSQRKSRSLQFETLKWKCLGMFLKFCLLEKLAKLTVYLCSEFPSVPNLQCNWC